VNIMQQIASASKQLETADRLRAAIGSALTAEQQLAVSERIASGPEKFIAWVNSDAGRAAIRKMADDFVAASA